MTTTAFKKDQYGNDYIVVDPDSVMDYSVATWVEGATFSTVVWTLDPAIAGAIYNESINGAQQTVDGTTYEIGELATAWIRYIPAGARHKVTLRATFSGGQIDDRSFYVRGREK